MDKRNKMKKQTSLREQLEKREENIFLVKIIFFIFIIFSLSYTHASCTHISMEKMWFYDTWICKKCGYDNYEHIKRCPICGTKKEGG